MNEDQLQDKLRELNIQLDLANDNEDLEQAMRLEDEIMELQQSLRAFHTQDGDAWSGGFAENH